LEENAEKFRNAQISQKVRRIFVKKRKNLLQCVEGKGIIEYWKGSCSTAVALSGQGGEMYVR